MEEIPSSLEVSNLLKEVFTKLKHRVIKRFDDLGITAPQGMVIGTLSRYGGMKVSQLSKHLGLSSSTVSGIVDRLEKQGIVERIRSKEDRRVVNVMLTRRFMEMHGDFHKKSEEILKSILQKATPEELDRILDGLNSLKKLLSDP